MRPDDIARALSNHWQIINRHVFGDALLAVPTIEVSDAMGRRLGEWSPSLRRIRLSEAFVTTSPWWVVIETLKHEMAHQYVSDVLGIEDEETSHGPAFRMVCERYGIDGRAAHRASEEELRIVERAKKLLALSQSPNENEAAAALRAVQKLLRQHGLREEDVSGRGDDGFGVTRVGEIVLKSERHSHVAGGILGRYFHVRGIWIATYDPRTDRKGEQLELVGKRSDLAMAAYVYEWLHTTAERLCPASLTRRERLDFFEGFMIGQDRHLKEQAASAHAATVGVSTALVVTNAQVADLDDYFDRRYPSTRSVRRSTRSVTESFQSGEHAGRSTTMRRPIEGGEPRLLRK